MNTCIFFSCAQMKDFAIHLCDRETCCAYEPWCEPQITKMFSKGNLYLYMPNFQRIRINFGDFKNHVLHIYVRGSIVLVLYICATYVERVFFEVFIQLWWQLTILAMGVQPSVKQVVGWVISHVAGIQKRGLKVRW